MMTTSEDPFEHGCEVSTGILLTNLGTPHAPTPSAVRTFLADFLWDPRVVELPRPLWWLILHGIILRVRPRRTARKYKEIWTDDGAPLRVITERQAGALSDRLDHRCSGPVKVAVGMRYGHPSIAEALRALRTVGVQRLLILPLYPQYSATTTASSFDAVVAELSDWRWLPELRLVTHYHDDPGYIEALANSVLDAWSRNECGERLLFSFHGLPKRNLLAGDPYHCECLKTARLTAERLGLEEGCWGVSFQSRFGRAEWLRPYTSDLLKDWATDGIKSVDVLCPGFAADCLETLEEIAMENRDVFTAAGGARYRYIPALNDSPRHIDALVDVVLQHTAGWPETSTNPHRELSQNERQRTRQRALARGAAR